MLVTVDVWDTLLRRRVHPDAVKLSVAKRLLLSGNVRSIYQDSHLLFRARQRIEGQIGRATKDLGKDDEYAHLDVLKRWVQEVCSNHLSQSDRMALDLVDWELREELRVTYADPGIVDLLRSQSQRNARLYFLSDFYMSSEHIRVLLRANGLDHFFLGGATSGEVALNKRSGRLFDWARSQWLWEDEKHLHIGDNEWSDVRVPLKRGIEAQLYCPEAENTLRKMRDGKFKSRNKLLSFYREPFDSADCPKSVLDSAYALGVRSAPLFLGFILFILEQAISSESSCVFFLTREGVFFKRLYDIVVAAGTLQCTIPATIIEASRVATFGPSVMNWTKDEFMRIWNQYSSQSARAFTVSLDLTGKFYIDKMRSHGLDPDKIIQYPWLDETFLKWFEDPAVVRAAMSEFESRRSILSNYLDQHFWSNRIGAVTLVDIGWRGTIQDNLANLRPSSRINGVYLGLKRLLNLQSASGQKNAYGPNLNKPASDVNWDWDFVAPIEMLTNAAGGSVVGYKVDQNGKVSAETILDESEEAVFTSFTREFQNGVCDFVKERAVEVADNAIGASEVRDAALNIWRNLLHSPPPILASAFFTLHHNERFGLGAFAKRSTVFSTPALLRLLLTKTGRLELAVRLENIGWFPGYLVFPGAQLTVKSLVRLYTFYKRVKAAAVESTRGVDHRSA